MDQDVVFLKTLTSSINCQSENDKKMLNDVMVAGGMVCTVRGSFFFRRPKILTFF